MLMNTHMILANNFLEIADGKKIYLINSKRFIWGNIKPDYVPKYKKIKHYYNESIDMTINKIKKLSSLSISDIYYDYGKNKFSEELGVVCHFLCDYFCYPHYDRWEFKKALKKHVTYENKLAKVAKTYSPRGYINENISANNIKNFIEDNLELYKLKSGYKNDLEYAHYICNSIISFILDEIVMNQYYYDEKVI